MPKPPPPTERDNRMQAAMAALIATGSTRKAAAQCGVNYRTILNWSKSSVGKAMLDELAKTHGTGLAEKCRSVASMYLESLEHDARDPAKLSKLNPVQKATVIGILVDKAKALTERVERAAGPIEVEVKFAGIAPTSAAQIAGQVTVRQNGGLASDPIP